MFRDVIYETAFTSDGANKIFKGRIDGPAVREDVSFLSTLRAIVGPKLADDQSLTFSYGDFDYAKSTIRSVGEHALFDAVIDSKWDKENFLYIIRFGGSQDDIDAQAQALRNVFESEHPEYVYRENITQFFAPNFPVWCYMDYERRTTFCIIPELDMRKLHYFQRAVLSFLPWFYDPEQGLGEEDRALLDALAEKKPDRYLACLEQMAERYDFETERIRDLLHGIETASARRSVASLEYNISNIREQIRSYNESIRSLLHNMENNNIRLLGLRQRIAEGGGEECSDLMEYFLSNKALVLENVVESTLYFCVKGYLENFDPEGAETYIGNRSGYIYDGHSGAVSKAQMQKLLTEIFLKEEPRLRVRFCAAYSITLGEGVGTQSHHSFGTKFSTYMPNPHINEWSCMGDYSRVINDLVQRGDMIGALEQCVASAKSLNWYDSTVMSTFMSTMFGENRVNNCAIELPDGTVVNPAGAVKWLESQEEQSNGQKEEA